MSDLESDLQFDNYNFTDDDSIYEIGVIADKPGVIIEMAAAAEYLKASFDLNNDDTVISIVSNAGAWVQNAGQLRRALRQSEPQFESNISQLIVVSDGFKLGHTGTEPTATHQNPFTALGQIARNAQELARHTS